MKKLIMALSLALLSMGATLAATQEETVSCWKEKRQVEEWVVCTSSSALQVSVSRQYDPAKDGGEDLFIASMQDFAKAALAGLYDYRAKLMREACGCKSERNCSSSD